MYTHTTRYILLLAFLLPVVMQTSAQQGTPLHYTVKRAQHAPLVDGIPAKKEWKHIVPTTAFVDITGDPGKTPAFKTQVRMQYDDSMLYILAWMEEQSVSAAMIHHDDLLFKENAFEVFIDADGDGKDYAEIEINAAGTVMDLRLDKPYKDGGKADMAWDLPGLRTAVHVRGTMNHGNDTDQGWYAELAVPFTALNGPGEKFSDHSWRINFLRVEKRQATNSNIPDENYWAWSPQGTVNMHIPEKWGYLHFTN